MVALSVEIKLRFQISGQAWNAPNLSVTKFDSLDLLWKKKYEEIIWLKKKHPERDPKKNK